ncbi:unnamed protein product [Prunus armeniaca]
MAGTMEKKIKAHKFRSPSSSSPAEQQGPHQAFLDDSSFQALFFLWKDKPLPKHWRLGSKDLPKAQIPTRYLATNGSRGSYSFYHTSSVNATSSLPAWGTRECHTALIEPGMLGYDYTKSNKFPTRELLLDCELGGLLFTQ